MNNARRRELLKEIVFKQYYKLVWLVFVNRFHDFLCLLKLFLESVIVPSIFSKCNDLLTPILLFVSCIRLLIFSAILKVVSYSFFFLLWKYALCFFLPLWPILLNSALCIPQLSVPEVNSYSFLLYFYSYFLDMYSGLLLLSISCDA